jgi:hypothetical protein
VKQPLERWRRWEDNIKIDLRKEGSEDRRGGSYTVVGFGISGTELLYFVTTICSSQCLFRLVTLYSVVLGHQCFVGPCCLVLTTMKTLNLALCLLMHGKALLHDSYNTIYVNGKHKQ